MYRESNNRNYGACWCNTCPGVTNYTTVAQALQDSDICVWILQKFAFIQTVLRQEQV